MKRKKIPSSFRDPSAYLFYYNNLIYRQLNLIYKEDYDHLMNSGLYKVLVDQELLNPHEEVNIDEKDFGNSNDAYKIIKPDLISFISYPYEWSFSQLKDAALVTLKIQRISIEFGMSLKDSSAYNIQFKNGKPVLIDTCSFEKYNEGQPWIAYRQFCQHFLGPLALMCYSDIRLNQLFRIYIDGIPLDLTSSLLPFRSRLKFSLFTHIHSHAKSQRYFADKFIKVNNNGFKVSRLSFLGLIDNLESAVRSLKWKRYNTEWADYYENTNYSMDGFQHKKQVVEDYLDRIKSSSLWDIGANEGVFSRIASNKGIQTISFDIDPAAVEKSYIRGIKNDELNVLPLLLDLTNPSPGIGWENQERMSVIDRGPTDTVIALALIHHLAICNNLPFNKISSFFYKICNFLIIEFVPKGDSQVQRMLSTREDIFPNYTQQFFEDEFAKYFNIQDCVVIRESERILYLMKRRDV